MSTLVEQREAARSEAEALIEKAKNGDTTVLDEAREKVELVKSLTERIHEAEVAEEMLGAIKDAPVTAPPAGETGVPEVKAGACGMGSRFTESDAYRGFMKQHPTGIDGGTPISLKAGNLGGLGELGLAVKQDPVLTSVSGQARGDRLPGYVSSLVDDKLSLLDLITPGRTNSASLEYAQITGETDGAAVVAEGAEKPLSDLKTALADAKAHTYADGFVATNQFLADEPALATFLDSRLRFHLRRKIEDMIVNGKGTAQEPKGILSTTGVQQVAFTEDALTTLSVAMEKLEAVDADVQAVVMNPADAWALRRLKDKDGRYLSGGPFDSGAISRVWGVPLVTSNRVAKGTSIAGDFRTIALLEREGISVMMFNQHADFARFNKVYVRAELRAMQLIYEPRALAVVKLSGEAA